VETDKDKNNEKEKKVEKIENDHMKRIIDLNKLED
jgi:hypothetical protein